MIVAIYVESISLLQPVSPVTRIKRITPQKRDSNNHTRQEASSFAALLAAASHVEREDASKGFDAIA